MNPDYTHITLILDRSGSMESIRAETVSGLNAFIEEQKKTPGKCTFTFVQFDMDLGKMCFDVLRDFVPIADVKPVGEEYAPRGYTPLYDAVANGIITTGAKLAQMPEAERPGKVVFVIMTDGEENASREYTKEAVAKMTREQEEKYKWQFVYLGANQDAMAVGAGIGVKVDNSATFAAHNSGAVLRSYSMKVSKYRGPSGQSADLSNSDQDRTDYTS